MARERFLYFTPLSMCGIKKMNVLIYSTTHYPDTGNRTSETRGLENCLVITAETTEQKFCYCLVTSTLCLNVLCVL